MSPQHSAIPETAGVPLGRAQCAWAESFCLVSGTCDTVMVTQKPYGPIILPCSRCGSRQEDHGELGRPCPQEGMGKSLATALARNVLTHTWTSESFKCPKSHLTQNLEPAGSCMSSMWVRMTPLLRLRQRVGRGLQSPRCPAECEFEGVICQVIGCFTTAVAVRT